MRGEVRGEAGGGAGGGRKERCSTKNKNPTRQCGEQSQQSRRLRSPEKLYALVLRVNAQDFSWPAEQEARDDDAENVWG